MARPSASTKVSQIVELLEHILLDVCNNDGAYIISDRDTRHRTILLSQRVSKAFRATIQGSRKLREALMLDHSIITPRPKDPINGLIFFKKIPIPGALLRVDWSTISIGTGGAPCTIHVRLAKTPIANKATEQDGASWREMFLMVGNYQVTHLMANDIPIGSPRVDRENATLGQLYEASGIQHDA
ncbi:hypothetical protein AC579_1334 [Pseudocercospora musae]|uniref:Uncharacterized protein n=1 Tax=Pseudocercospora musae TaxID=113226 RepID=A0A139IP12_9PEZI|nr:hypothetical protein AC579_1334 [Pseudocercospora musae]